MIVLIAPLSFLLLGKLADMHWRKSPYINDISWCPIPCYLKTRRYIHLLAVIDAVLSFFQQVLKKYPHLWCMSKPPRHRPKLYIVNLQVSIL